MKHFIEVDARNEVMRDLRNNSARAVCLLSGGLDSPVAAWLSMRSGLRIELVHFHSYPFSCTSAIQKARELASLLLPLQRGGNLHLVPFLDIQESIFRNTVNSLRIVMYRRAMARIAERIAESCGASFLVTGDSLGQVSSQTLSNLSTVEEAVAMPLLRPLIGFDKTEIVDIGKSIGTFDISIRPHEDCCTLFSVGKPATHTEASKVAAEERKFDMHALIEAAFASREIVTFEGNKRLLRTASMGGQI